MDRHAILTVLVSVLILSLGSVHTAVASDVSMQWDCSSELGCSAHGDGCGSYKDIGGNRNYDFAFSADPGTYSCDVEVKNCCYGFSGDIPQVNEYSDVYLNGADVGETNDLFCNEAGENGNGGEGGCYLFSSSEYTCKSHSECNWQEFLWYNKPGTSCHDDCTALGLPYRQGKGCKNASVDSHLIQKGFTQDQIDCCSSYYHSRWCGYCDGNNMAGTKDVKYCGDVTYLKKDCGFDSETVVKPVKPAQGLINGVKCRTYMDHTVLKGHDVPGLGITSSGIECSKLYDITDHDEGEEEEYPRIRLLAFLHFKDPDNPNYICCYGYQVDDGLRCVDDSECKNGNCGANNICGGGNGGGCDPGCGTGEICCSGSCYTGNCCTDNDCGSTETCSISHVCTEETTHRICSPLGRCRTIPGPGDDECNTDGDCGSITADSGGNEMESDADRVYFGISFDGFGRDDDGDEVEGTRLSFATGCTYCGDTIKSIPVGQAELGATNTLRLRAYDSHGLKSVSISCTKLDPPVANAGPDQTVGLAGPYVNAVFNGLGSDDPDGYIVDYRWDFDDGYFGNGISTSHNYYDEGTYTVSLEVTDNDGLKDTDTMQLMVGRAPNITDDYAHDGVWVDSDQTVVLTAQDDTGIDRAMYCNGADCDPGSGSILSGPPYTMSFSQDMDRAVRYRAWDTYDNPSGIGEFNVKIDKTVPATTDSHDDQVHGNGYAVSLSCSDTGSGCKDTRYCVSGNGSSICSPVIMGTTAVVTCESFSYCEKVVRYYSADNVNNQESSKTSGTVRIDTRISTCEMTALDPYATSESIGLAWSGRDSNGQEIGTGGEYKIWYKQGDSGTWAVWQDVFPSTTKSGTFAGENGNSYSFRCQSSDTSGWGSYSTPVSTFIDTEPPTASLGQMPEWTIQDVFQVSWSGQDSGSGVRDYTLEYSTSPPSWNSWVSGTDLTSGDFGNGDPVTVSDGTSYYFRVRARDDAGNTGEWSATGNTGLDLSAPACAITGLPEYIQTTDFSVSWSGQDSGSGVRDYRIEYGSDGVSWIEFENWTTDTSKMASLIDDEYYFRCMARDDAGNTGEWSASESTKVDTRAPGTDAVYEPSILGSENITVNVSVYDISDITSVTLAYEDVVVTETDAVYTGANSWNVLWTFPVDDEYGSDEFVVVTEDMHGNSRSFRYFFDIVLCEDGEVQDCGTNVGECIKGNQTCVDGLWGNCLGGLRKSLEVCDGKDNDCDGHIDDDIICSCVPGDTQECGTDTGECVKGTQTCTSEQAWGPCVGDYLGPSAELCDGKDNDCDGAIDNGAMCCQEGAKRPCGFGNIGICELGERDCRNGVWGNCIGAVMPEVNDICGNGLDDNCDGDTDEGCALCSNREQDGDEEGVDCGGPCPECPDFPWFILSIIGAIILVALIAVWWFLKSKGEELTWETVKDKWS